MFGLIEPCRQIHGRSSWISISLAEEKEGGGRGRKKQEDWGWDGAQYGSQALLWHLHGHRRGCHPKTPSSLTQLQPGQTGQDQLKSRTHPTCSSPNPGLHPDVMSYTCHTPLPKNQRQTWREGVQPQEAAGAPLQGLCDGC